MKTAWTLLCAALCALGAFAETEIKVTGVTAQQRYPWNGKVDIAVSFTCAAGTSDGVSFTFAATNNASKAAIPVAHLTLNGADTISGTTCMRKFIWNADADVDDEKISDVTLSVEAKLLVGVQLWENGPYFATCNVGAEKPEDYGCYFWWGDTVGYKRNSSNSGWASAQSGFSFRFLSSNCRTWDTDTSKLRMLGYIDSMDNLTRMFDAAAAHLGAPWRMPTFAELSALWDKCDKTWTTINGVNGYLFKGRGAYSSKSIFLPAAGYGANSSLANIGTCGQYWSSTSYPWGSAYRAYNFDFNQGYLSTKGEDRFYGRSVRPVREFAEVAVSSASTVFAYDGRVSEDPGPSVVGGDYTVRFTKSGGMETLTMNCRSGVVFNLPVNPFTPPAGKRFAGWLGSNGRRYDSGMLVFNLVQPGETVTLTAIWE